MVLEVRGVKSWSYIRGLGREGAPGVRDHALTGSERLLCGPPQGGRHWQFIFALYNHVGV